MWQHQPRLAIVYCQVHTAPASVTSFSLAFSYETIIARLNFSSTEDHREISVRGWFSQYLGEIYVRQSVTSPFMFPWYHAITSYLRGFGFCLLLNKVLIPLIHHGYQNITSLANGVDDDSFVRKEYTPLTLGWSLLESFQMIVIIIGIITIISTIIMIISV